MRKLDGPLTHKVCPRCGVDKPASEFHRSRTATSGLAGNCKDCAKALLYEWRQKHPERTRDIDRRWQQKHGRRRQLVRRYGITVAEYEAWLRAQGGVCALCRQPETTRQGNGDEPRLLGVDHDHATGRIRGLLCHRCNSALEHLVSNPEVLRNLPTYLQ